jgi:ketosteroid isomerase-like protein
MPEAIAPPRADHPNEACRLVCDAVSDGDLDAALVHYEPAAVIVTHTTVRGREQIRGLLAAAADSRKLFTIAVRRTVLADDIALVTGDWTSHGTGPGGRPVISGGHYRSVVRLDAASHWRIAVETITADPSADDNHLPEQNR